MSITLAEEGPTSQPSLLPHTGAPTLKDALCAQVGRDVDTIKSALLMLENCAEGLDAAVVAALQRDGTARALLQRAATCLHNMCEAWMGEQHIAPDLINEALRLTSAAQHELDQGGV